MPDVGGQAPTTLVKPFRWHRWAAITKSPGSCGECGQVIQPPEIFFWKFTKTNFYNVCKPCARGAGVPEDLIEEQAEA